MGALRIKAYSRIYMKPTHNFDFSSKRLAPNYGSRARLLSGFKELPERQEASEVKLSLETPDVVNEFKKTRY